MTVKDLFIFIADKTNNATGAHDNHKTMLAIKYIALKIGVSGRAVQSWLDNNFIARDHRVSFYNLLRELGHDLKLSELNRLKSVKKAVL